MDIVALKQSLFNYVDTNSEELLKLCSDLIRFPTENPTVDTTDITKYIVNYIEDAGLTTKVHESNDKMFNIIATNESDNETSKNLILCGHTDVVPAGDRENWDFDPFSGEIKDGWLLGRGASDMKAGLGGIIFATAALGKLNIKLPGKVTLAIVPDEETGGEYGVPWLLENELITGDGCLIEEPSSPQNPTIGQKGSYDIKLNTFVVTNDRSKDRDDSDEANDEKIIKHNEINNLMYNNNSSSNEVENLLVDYKMNMDEIQKERNHNEPNLEKITDNNGK